MPLICKNFVCGAEGIRTPDPLHAMEVRYQLRYSPVNRINVPPETRDSIPAASTSSHQPRPSLGDRRVTPLRIKPAPAQAAGACR